MSEIADPVATEPRPDAPIAHGSVRDGTLHTAAWAAGLALAALIGCVTLEYFPFRYTMPPELTGMAIAYSPELQAEAAELKTSYEWRNSLIQLSLVGACFGLIPPLLATGGGPRRAIPVALIGLLVGAICGAAAGASAYGLRGALFAEDGSGMLGGTTSMMDDVLNYAVVSLLIAVPAGVLFLVRTIPQAGQKFISVPLGGMVAGMLVPILASFIFPDFNTEILPSPAFALNAFWLGLVALMVFLLTVMTGERRPKHHAAVAAAE